MTPEKKVQNSIEKYLSRLQTDHPEYHILFFRRQALAGMGYKNGLPDIFVIVNGLHLEVEIKKPGGTPSAFQIKWQREFKNNNVPCCIVDSLDEFKKFISEFL